MDNSKRDLKLWQFNLRTLLAITLIVFLISAWFVERSKLEEINDQIREVRIIAGDRAEAADVKAAYAAHDLRSWRMAIGQLEAKVAALQQQAVQTQPTDPPADTEMERSVLRGN